MKKSIIVIVILVLAFVGYFVWRVMSASNAAPGAVAAPETAIPDAIAPVAVSEYTETYTHPAGDFTFMYPKSFVTASMPSGDSGEAITVQDKNGKNGLQILVNAFDGGDIDITADVIHASIPDLKITDPRAVDIASGRKGLAFLSDNSAFGDSSSELWFVYRGKLYQLSTYAASDAFLRGVFGTWRFTQK